MKKYAFVAALVAATCWSVASKPMESVDRYNVVLVHGAADRWQGLDCEKGNPKDKNRAYSDAFSYRSGVDGFVRDTNTCVKDSLGIQCDTTFSYYLPSRIGGKVKSVGDTGSSATGMVKELAPLLRDTILESPLSVYLQRPFTRPAASPADNGDEIGKSSWKGENKCSARRSLIEEAQQFKAKGVMRLDSLRTNSVHEYRTIPSRNILIGHSMGGVAIREYVQGANYNLDVDKFITLDSPHEGTGALNMLLALKSRLEAARKAMDNAAVKFGEGSTKEGTIWKITPKDASKPTLYYSSKMKKVVKMTAVVNGAESESKYEYCDNTCELPGTLKKVNITTKLPTGEESTVTVDVLFAKQHHRLPKKMFDIE